MNIPEFFPVTRRAGACAFTLPEVVIGLAIATIVYGGVLLAYVHTAQRAEWSGYSMAAQALSIRQMEEVRAAKWDTQQTPIVDETTNLNTNTVAILDIPFSGTNMVYATNYSTVTNVTISTGVSVKMIRVDTVWKFGIFRNYSMGTNRFFTNSVVTYRSPNQ
jgi:type II secretory pathway pseudopilin PulG